MWNLPLARDANANLVYGDFRAREGTSDSTHLTAPLHTPPFHPHRRSSHPQVLHLQQDFHSFCVSCDWSFCLLLHELTRQDHPGRGGSGSPCLKGDDHPSTEMTSSSSNVVGVHYRVGKKIGEGSFGVIFEGTNLLNNQQVAIKFVSPPIILHDLANVDRNPENRMPLNCEMNIAHTRSWSDAVSPTSPELVLD
jgi:hypothetical protein